MAGPKAGVEQDLIVGASEVKFVMEKAEKLWSRERLQQPEEQEKYVAATT